MVSKRTENLLEYEKKRDIETKRAEAERIFLDKDCLLSNLKQPQKIREAIVLSEIIGKPRSLNQWQY